MGGNIQFCSGFKFEAGFGSIGRAQRRALETRRRLLDAARQLFCEIGIDAATIEKITERADLGKGTFYRHFSGKDELMGALVQEAAASLVERIGPSGQAKSLPEALHQMLNAHIDFFMERRHEFILLFQSRVLMMLERDTAEVEEPIAAYLAALEEKIACFAARGINPVRVRRLACALAGFVTGFLSFAMIGMTPEEVETSLGPLRQAFVTGSSAFLIDKA